MSVTRTCRTPARRRVTLWLAAAISGLLFVFAGTSPSHAAHQDGVADWGEAMMYFNSAAYGYGSFSDYADSVNFGSSVFLSSGSGQGQIVWNNAAAAWNNSYNYVTVFYNSGWDCSIACQDIGSLLKVDLSFALKNENASILIY